MNHVPQDNAAPPAVAASTSSQKSVPEILVFEKDTSPGNESSNYFDLVRCREWIQHKEPVPEKLCSCEQAVDLFDALGDAFNIKSVKERKISAAKTISDHLCSFHLGCGASAENENSFKKDLGINVLTYLKMRVINEKKEQALVNLIDDGYKRLCASVSNQLSLDTEMPPDELEADEQIDNNRVNFQSGLLQAKQVMENVNQGPHTKESMKDVEKILNHLNLLRYDVTNLILAVFDSKKGFDIYTRVSQADYDDEETMSELSLTYPAFKKRPSKAANTIVEGDDITIEAVIQERQRRLCEVDHIWEVQLFALAIREVERAHPGSFTLSNLVYLASVINDVNNLNVTSWNLNGTKGKLFKDFKNSYDIVFGLKNRNLISLENLIMSKGAYIRIFREAIPPQKGSTTELVLSTVESQLKVEMYNVLVTHLYEKLFDNNNENIDSNYKRLWFVLCDMYNVLFPPELGSRNGQ